MWSRATRGPEQSTSNAVNSVPGQRCTERPTPSPEVSPEAKLQVCCPPEHPTAQRNAAHAPSVQQSAAVARGYQLLTRPNDTLVLPKTSPTVPRHQRTFSEGTERVTRPGGHRCFCCHTAIPHAWSQKEGLPSTDRTFRLSVSKQHSPDFPCKAAHLAAPGHAGK